jgi:nucleotide-binding universal stress UspA family protein
MSKRVFIVPHDFTFTADNALDHAVNLSKQINAQIALVHIVAKENELDSAKLKLDSIVNSFPDADIFSHVIHGSIFTDIGNYAEEKNAVAIIMGTHGSKGMQKVFGSFAMKVIISTSVPFMIVQDNSEIRNIKNIVFSINTSIESLQIASLAGNIAKMFDSTIHIIGQKESELHRVKKIKSNLLGLAKQLSKMNVNCKLDLIDDDKDYFVSMSEYAKSVNADLLAYSYDSDKFFASNDKFAQAIIFNDLNLPSIVINSQTAVKTTY